ncbi:hypothetical protein Slala05_13750 [Streptomyces lavendulae subsp. lavendulae]|nr:hypothetical protein Slala05_13750 [Streptomyces lavendulae subsp. lavendulae]
MPWAELMWRDAGFEIIVFPTEWSAHRGAAGLKRKREVVDSAQVFREAGAQVLCTAFLDLCHTPGCPKRSQEQLMPDTPGHFSHGTIHCRARAGLRGSRRPMRSIRSEDARWALQCAAGPIGGE